MNAASVGYFSLHAMFPSLTDHIVCDGVTGSSSADSDASVNDRRESSIDYNIIYNRTEMYNRDKNSRVRLIS